MTHPNEFDDMQRSDDKTRAFDAAARAAHADAIDHVSARVQAQLQQRRRAALSNRASARPLWPALALGGAAAVALAVGLRFTRDSTEAPTAPNVATTSSDTRGTAPAIAATDDTNDDSSVDRSTREAIAANQPTKETTGTTADTTVDTTLTEVDDLLADNGNSDDTTLLAANDDALLADLDENPDMYLWLGSDESLGETTEVL